AFAAEKTFSDSLIDAVEAAVLVVTRDNRVVRSNPYLHAVAAFEARDLQGRDWCDWLLPEADRPRGRLMVKEALEQGSSRGGVLRLVRRSGRRRAIAWSARALRQGSGPAEVVLFGQDVTDLQEAQEKAVQVERLAAIGQMVAGLAHES